MHSSNTDIKLVFFSSIIDKHFKKILNGIPQSFPKDRIFRCKTISDFSNTLKETLFGLSIILVVIRREDELNEIYQMSGSLKDHSMILILSDDVDEMSQKAIRLYPRYTSYIKEDYNDVSQVLKKMIQNIENKSKGENDGRFNRYN